MVEGCGEGRVVLSTHWLPQQAGEGHVEHALVASAGAENFQFTGTDTGIILNVKITLRYF